MLRGLVGKVVTDAGRMGARMRNGACSTTCLDIVGSIP